MSGNAVRLLRESARRLAAPNVTEATPPDLAAFADGFAAGYNAKSEQRAVFGSREYRLGHEEGVRAAARRRQREVEADGRRSWIGIVVAVLLGLLIGWGTMKAAGADTIGNWQALNEMCQGGAGATSDKACTQRQLVVSQLRREGWFQGQHGVWVSPEHVATFTRIVRSYDATARANAGMLGTVMQGMMEDLRRQVPPEAVFALWNGRAGELLASTPYAASMLMYGLPYLERQLSGRNDPRFRMVLRP